ANLSTTLLPRTLPRAEGPSAHPRPTASHLITQNGVVVGTIQVEALGTEWSGALWSFAPISLIIFLAAAGTAFILSFRFHHFISDPIESLVETSHSAMREKKLTVRSPTPGKDELAILGDSV